MAYIGIGSRAVTAAKDTTGLNSGNWTSYFSVAVLASRVPHYEVYSLNVTGITQITTVVVYVNGQVRSTAKLIGNSEWDPAQPILLNDGDDLALTYNLTASGTPPAATAWLRYDPVVNKGMI